MEKKRKYLLILDMNFPMSDMEEGSSEEIQEYWLPFIKLKLDMEGNVLLEGSSLGLHRYQNNTLMCTQIHHDVLFIAEKTSH